MMVARKPSISVVMPVFNASETVLASLSSVLDHTVAEVEVVCVDDGCTDGSAAVLARLAAADPRVTVVSLGSNQGECKARNTGIELAVGEYIFCLDADDTVPPGALDVLLSAATSTGCELTIGKLLWLKSAEEACTPIQLSAGREVGTSNVHDSTWLQSVPGSHCCNLYNRQMLARHGIRYADDLTLGGDQLFQATAIVKAETVAIVDDVVYVYHHYRGQSVTKLPPSLKNVLDDVEFQSRIARLYASHGLQEAGLRFLRSSWSYSIRNYWLQLPMTLTGDEAKRFFSAFRRMAVEFGVNPWNESTPEHHRHVLGLILSGKDEQAFGFLATEQARCGLV